MWRFLLLILLCVGITFYYKTCVEPNVNDTEVHADTIVVDSVVYDYDDWVQMQWSVDSGYGKAN